MNDVYHEILDGETCLRFAPGPRHELICTRLHALVGASIANMPPAQILAPRSPIQISPHSQVRPDLTIVTAANNKPWLIAEIVSSDVHKPDTVIKKQIYEDAKIPRLWMIDPRYDNVEVYHATQYGMALKYILAGKELLTEKLFPEFELTIADLFKD